MTLLKSVLISIVLLTCSTTNAWSPTNSYAPGKVDCPSGNLLREANGLSDNEKSWLEQRHKITDQAIKDFLTYNNSMTDFDVNSFFNQINESIGIGIAFSGGGYRAMLCGAGQLSALDNRTTNAFEQGLGGILQTSSYLVGLSGGNWLTGTISMNNFTSVEDILNDDNNTIWDLSEPIYNPGGANIFHTATYYDDIYNDIKAKKNAGFELSITDIWARALSYQFFNDSLHGAALTWSGLRGADVFKNSEMPFPISVTDGRTPGTTIVNSNSTVFEVTPFELGSWDQYVNAFTDVNYLGSNVSNGTSIDSESKCIAGFDNAGFIMGTSSSLFNAFLVDLNTTSINKVFKEMISYVLTDVSNDENDIAIYKPNPFKDSPFGTSESIIKNDTLFLVDGGEDGQNVPLLPLLQPARNVDLIFAFDNSADTDYHWPDGYSLTATYDRQFTFPNTSASFPYVPDINSFRNLNLTNKPVFFGCDSNNLTGLAQIPPLVIYIANRPYSYNSNTSTFKMTYSEEEKRSMITNGFEVASRNNHTDFFGVSDKATEAWKVCVSCAMIRRSQERHNITQSEQCQKCFSDYCWNGKLDTTNVSEATYNVDPSDGTTTVSSTGTTSSASPTGKPKKNSGATVFNVNKSVLVIALITLLCVLDIC